MASPHMSESIYLGVLRQINFVSELESTGSSSVSMRSCPASASCRSWARRTLSPWFYWADWKLQPINCRSRVDQLRLGEVVARRSKVKQAGPERFQRTW